MKIREFQGEFRWLSNFWSCKITLNGITFHSVEAAYMSAKSNDPEWKKFCSDIRNSPGQIKRKGRTIQLIKDWDVKKLQVMEECLRQKFSKPELKQKLLETGNALIEEGNMWGDKFWGICLKTGQGKNMLGQLIMKIRGEINETGQC